jgi:hypothetical protein
LRWRRIWPGQAATHARWRALHAGDPPAFGWLPPGTHPPHRWNLSRLGWRLIEGDYASGKCATGASLHPILCDGRAMIGQAPPAPIWPRRRIIIVNVRSARRRAALLAAGYGEVLPPRTTLCEIAVRAARLEAQCRTVPRLRRAGPLVLDLFYRDARMDGRWLRLHPREFALI